MATNLELIDRALTKVGLGGRPSGSNEINRSFIELQDFLSEIKANGMDVSYNDESGITDETGIPNQFFSAITALMGKRLAETFDIAIGSQLEMQASAGAQTLAKLTTQTPTWKQPNRMPIGSGNNKNGYEWRRYYSDVQVIPTQGDQ